jgi:hypothetical protein
MRKPKTPGEALRALMRAHELTNAEVAELAHVNLKTVESWLASETAASFRRMPARQLLLIEALLPAYLERRG